MTVTLNHMPQHHTRKDYDYEYKTGERGPIRVGDTVWCNRHGWEAEIKPTSWISRYTAYNKPFLYRWTCPTCGRTADRKLRATPGGDRLFYTEKMALWGHINGNHDGIVPYRRNRWTEEDRNADPRMFVKGAPGT